MKKLMIKNGSYTDKKTGEVKNKWLELGIILNGDNGEYALLDPAVNLAAFKEQGKDKIIVSIFEEKPKDEVKQTNSDVDFDDEIGF